MAMMDDCRKYFTKNCENKGKFVSLYIQILHNHKMETVVDSKRKYNCVYRSSLELPFRVVSPDCPMICALIP